MKRTVYREVLCRSGGGAQVPMQRSHLACIAGAVVNEYPSNMRMVEEMGRAGAKALSDWLRKCRVALTEVKEANYLCEAVRAL